MNHLPRFMIAAAHKSSGKTVVSTGLSGALCQTGSSVTPFKKGPDYIDPMWLSEASGNPCYNLDFFTMGRDNIAPFFASRAGALSLIEANKGLFDGVQTDGSDSNAALAKLLDLPVILVIDTMGMTRGIAPLLMGYQVFDKGVNIAGVILNKVGGSRHEGKLLKAVGTYSDLPVVGSVWRDSRLEIGERHLGLTTPAETLKKKQLIAGFSDIVGQSVDLDLVRSIAQSAPDIPAPAPSGKTIVAKWPGLRIGILSDAAFGFYYPDDLEAIKAAGAELVRINAISDTHLPDIDGLFIGGGFPECRMEELSANVQMRHAIKERLQNGLPCYAECGGLMYLCSTLRWGATSCPMVGLIEANAVMHERPQGRGYVSFDCSDEHLWGTGQKAVPAHEFHYASIEGLAGESTFTRNILRGHGVDGHNDGIVIGNTLAGFCHLRNTPLSPWVSRFLDFVGECK